MLDDEESFQKSYATVKNPSRSSHSSSSSGEEENEDDEHVRAAKRIRLTNQKLEKIRSVKQDLLDQELENLTNELLMRKKVLEE